MLRRITVILLFGCFFLSSCAYIDVEADPTTGKITKLHYRGFARQYDWLMEEGKDTRKIQLGARSELDKAIDLLKALGPVGIGALTGGAGAALGGATP